MIDRNKSLPGALGNAYERVKEILSGYTQIGGAPPRPPKGPNPNGNGNGNGTGHRPQNGQQPQPPNGVAPRRKRDRRARAQRRNKP